MAKAPEEDTKKNEKDEKKPLLSKDTVSAMITGFPSKGKDKEYRVNIGVLVEDGTLKMKLTEPHPPFADKYDLQPIGNSFESTGQRTCEFFAHRTDKKVTSAQTVHVEVDRGDARNIEKLRSTINEKSSCLFLHDVNDEADLKKIGILVKDDGKTIAKFCSASLVDRDYILTAAHCFQGFDTSEWREDGYKDMAPKKYQFYEDPVTLYFCSGWNGVFNDLKRKQRKDALGKCVKVTKAWVDPWREKAEKELEEYLKKHAEKKDLEGNKDVFEKYKGLLPPYDTAIGKLDEPIDTEGLEMRAIGEKETNVYALGYPGRYGGFAKRAGFEGNELKSESVFNWFTEEALKGMNKFEGNVAITGDEKFPGYQIASTFCGGGMSGSPVFGKDGKQIGVHVSGSCGGLYSGVAPLQNVEKALKDLKDGKMEQKEQKEQKDEKQQKENRARIEPNYADLPSDASYFGHREHHLPHRSQYLGHQSQSHHTVDYESQHRGYDGYGGYNGDYLTVLLFIVLVFAICLICLVVNMCIGAGCFVFGKYTRWFVQKRKPIQIPSFDEEEEV